MKWLSIISVIILIYIGSLLTVNSLYDITFPSISVFPERILSKYEKSLSNIPNIDSTVFKNEIEQILSKVKKGNKLIYDEPAILSTYLIYKGTKHISEVENYTEIILTRDYGQNKILDSLNQVLSYLFTFYNITIRNFEDDIISFIAILNSSSMTQKSNEIIAVDIIRQKLRDVYHQSLTMLDLRIKIISNNSVSRANMFISVTALFIALLSILFSLYKQISDKQSEPKLLSSEEDDID